MTALASTPAVTPRWSSSLTFFWAAVGSAVGLGSIWKFPYMAGANGGGAFVLVYLGLVAVVGVPILAAELSMGRHGGPSVLRALGRVARRGGRAWNGLGWLAGVTALLILSFYSVVAGWALAYAVKGALAGFEGLSPQGSAALFDRLLADPAQMIAWHSLLMGATAWIVARGVKDGIEAAVTWLMPVLAVLLAGLAVYAGITGDFARGFAFLFKPDFAALTSEAVLAAAGHAFFTLSLGMGAMVVYGGYLSPEMSIPRTAVWVAASDTACSLVAGLAIFPLVFAFGLDPAGGPGLLFVTLPVAFGAMPGGALFGTLFFVLVTVAALVSAVALLEPLVAAIGGQGEGRRRWTWRLALLAWTLGLVSVLSFNLWSGVRPPGSALNLFDWLNHVTTDLALPIGGIGIALFAGWVAPKALTASDFASRTWHRIWLILVRVLSPALVAVVLLDIVL